MTDIPAFEIIGRARQSRWLLTCDHATNRIPPEFGGTLGIPEADMARHIAYDVGAKGVTLELSKLLDSPAILSDFSRLVIDPNRGADDPTLVRKIYDGSVIPANRDAGPDEIARRIDAYYRPYHDAYEALAAAREDVVICAVHSFTPQLKGRPRRPWQIGILSAYDKRFTDPLIDELQNDPTLKAEAEALGERLVIGDNEPYDGSLRGDAVDTHALRHGRLNVLIELRSDLIETPEAQKKWAHLLAPILTRTLDRLSR
ncbi:N-formylglutamate amidohydrolase [Celeribacter sp.]|uniref:N-formylglutamate amidohydrolase n=1 Tax=Celeribacter sp. TaxID=1890673 RepID=UPI003A94059A